MEINAREISDLDPGAIPGGSTNLFQPGYRQPDIRGFLGADQFRQACKGVAFFRLPAVIGLFLDANDNFAEGYALAA